MSREVSRNGEPPPLREFALLLRSVAATVPATSMLYLAAEMLTPGRNKEDRAYNQAVLDMTARLLGFETDNPDLVERVLRNLPDL